MATNFIGLKIDVDTERGTRDGVPALLRLLDKHQVRATFLFALGPDNTGRALRRVFRPGFLSKVKRTSVVSTYGLRTLGNGILWPGPHIGKRHAALMREVKQAGHEVGIHCYDHIVWQDKLHNMPLDQVRLNVKKAVDVFGDIFGHAPTTMGAAGWQVNRYSLQAYDELQTLTYASDVRGEAPFYPSVDGQSFITLQLPTTMPTLDEVLGLVPFENLHAYWDKWLEQVWRVFTLHAEMEGGPYRDWFDGLLQRWKMLGHQPCACAYLVPTSAPTGILNPFGSVSGRSGTLGVQVA